MDNSRKDARRPDLNSLTVDEFVPANVEDECDAASRLKFGERFCFWWKLLFLQGFDASDRRLMLDQVAHIFTLKFANLFLQGKIFINEAYIFFLEIRRGLRRFPRFQLEAPNVKAVGAALAAPTRAQSYTDDNNQGDKE